MSEADRFWSKVDRSGGPSACWPWKAAVDRWGYGRFAIAGGTREIGAHRQAYLLANGPTHLLVIHSCDNPPCCNPAHLSAGTPAENMRDKVARGRARNQHTRHIPLSSAALASPRRRGSRQGDTPSAAGTGFSG